jgi:hypothetical protein
VLDHPDEFNLDKLGPDSEKRLVAHLSGHPKGNLIPWARLALWEMAKGIRFWSDQPSPPDQDSAENPLPSRVPGTSRM